MEIDRHHNARRLVATARVLVLLALAAVLGYHTFDGTTRIVVLASVTVRQLGLQLAP